FSLPTRHPPSSQLFPYTTLFRSTGRGKLEPCSREEELQNAEDVALARGPCVLPPRDPLLEQRPGVAGFEDERRLALDGAPLDALDPVGRAIRDLRAAGRQVARAHAHLRSGFDLRRQGGVAPAIVSQYDAAAAPEWPVVHRRLDYVGRYVQQRRRKAGRPDSRRSGYPSGRGA